MLRATASLSADQRRIEVRFPYSPLGIEVSRDAGGKWSPSKRAWTWPLDLTSARRLREAFGAGLTIAPDLRRWGKLEIRRQALFRQMAQARTAKLRRIPKEMPELAAHLRRRPYQAADISIMARANMLNANEPGTGKTFEIIGTAVEAGLLDRPVLTLAPVRSIENTWAEELSKAGYPHPILASEDGSLRKDALSYAATLSEAGQPFWLVLNPDFARLKPIHDDDKKTPVVARDPVSGKRYRAAYPELFGISFGLIALDEFHKFGLTNTRSQFGLGARKLKGERLILSSGTPMGGKYKRLWAALNWIDPGTYGSWWRWAIQWLVMTDKGFGKHVHDQIQPGREEEFRRAHAHHMIRRTKLRELPGCPPKVHRVIMCGMTAQQKRQYESFDEEAEIRINNKRLAGHGLLAEWTRLRSFANATCRVTRKNNGKLRVLATQDSGKLPYLIDALDEVGVRKADPEPGARAIVGTMDKPFAYVTAAHLEQKGIDTDTLTGDTKDSKEIIRRFRSSDPKPYVIVMTIQTGGVSLNLESAGSIHALDESWDPDDMTQFFDRGDRGSRERALLCFTYRTRDTIQEHIAEVASGKEINNQNVYKVRELLRKR